MRMTGLSAQALIAAVFGVAVAGTVIAVPRLVAPEARAETAGELIVVQAPAGAPLSFADLIEKVEPAVVSVNVISLQEIGRLSDADRFFELFRGMPGFDEYLERRGGGGDDQPRTRQAQSLGSGFFISNDGFIVTNHHVIDRATQIKVVTHDGRELEAELVGADPPTDLAVLRVMEAGSYPFVQFGSTENLRKGDWVVALGNPFGLGGTATAGIVSADNRDIGGNRNPYTDFLQIDASINRGNSGGPTFDIYGNVIGVNSQILSPTGGSVGIGFAIPAELARDVTNTLIESGRVSRGWLGVQISNLTPDYAEALGLDDIRGALIAEVTAGSPAERAGLRRNDIILSVNGQMVTDASTTTRTVARLIANTSNRFDILREGRRQTVNVVVGERPEDPATATAPRPPGSAGPGDESRSGIPGTMLDDFGVRLEPMGEDVRDRLGLRTGETGLVVTELVRGGVFAEAGFDTGMVLLEANGRPLPSVDAFRRAVRDARASNRSKILLAVRIGQLTNYRTVDIPEN